MKSHRHVPIYLVVVLLLALGVLSGAGTTVAQSGSRTFPETGKTISGLFLQYWNTHGGLAQQGYPISQEMQEQSDLNGQTYTVQYFERAVFEKHPENQPPYDVLLSQLGTFRYRQKYPNGAPNQKANQEKFNAHRFPETGYTVGGKFWTYWQAHGGLAQQGYPISDEFTEVSDLDGKPYTVQYFERAVFELHPENQAPYDVLLSQLGTFQYRTKYQTPPTPTAVPATPTPVLPQLLTTCPPPRQCTSSLHLTKSTGYQFYGYDPYGGAGLWSFGFDDPLQQTVHLGRVPVDGGIKQDYALLDTCRTTPQGFVAVVAKVVPGMAPNCLDTVFSYQAYGSWTNAEVNVRSFLGNNLRLP